ncbi:S-adenosyl-L-methionine-dependent methyltransferases superfamily protein [Striga hermonthica]|uniref:S-adenosyl-L-methionine-dependent methyltransferases superfamily protein n=1 Tax=Striga hermonthica TaxID=68872 RepID=A0A9N7MXS0_STRHE|nr:S-adenosyl-L-methionine-dependent methyltransferases superfamily protein [Striga hermonthica]
MASQRVSVHMNTGNGETSYTNNSSHQKIGILKSWHVLDESLKDMFSKGFTRQRQQCFRMADLGCSSGPNALLLVSRITEKIEELCKENGCTGGPEVEVFLNDLPGNDFNNLFMMLPEFYPRHPNTFVYGLPGSFYGRLVPSNTLDFVYSSYSLQWLSRVPHGLENNRENIHMAKASPPDVFEAYYKQYKTDFTTFLESRAAEMGVGAHMVLTFVGRSVDKPSTKDETEHFKLLSDTLLDMVQEELVKEADLYSFNMPIYTPSRQEVETLIREQGSFNLDRVEGFFIPWDAHVKLGDDSDGKVDTFKRGELVSNFIRAYTEPVLASHFGKSIVDDLYARFAKKLAKHLSEEEPMFFNMVISLSKK